MTETRQAARIDEGRRQTPLGYNVQESEVLDLIRRAEAHELGRSFLAQGAQDAVAATFGVHAFLVDAARDRLTNGTPRA